MKRLLFILCLLCSAEVFAQHYTVEYWFDQNYGGHDTVSVNTSAWQMQLDVAQLDVGFHLLHLQVRDTVGAYSAPRSFVFYNSYNVDSVSYRIWFDQNYADGQIGHFGNGNSLIDVGALSKGFHIINIQFGVGPNTELHSYVFYKDYSPDSLFTNLNYVCWFDQDYANRQMGTLGNGNFLLDVDSLTAGTHILNLQLGSGLNAELHSYIFYKTFSPDSVFPNVEYVCWFDQNYANRQTGTLGTGNLLFDVDSLKGGIHIFNLQFGDGMDAELHSYVFYKEFEYDSIFRNTEYVRWFDQDYANRQVGVIDSGYMLIDISSMTIGPHYLNLQFGEGLDAELRSFLFYKVETFYDTAILDVCDWTLWYDSIYTVSGEYGQEREAILPNCYDTVATLYLNVRYSSTGDTSAIVCDSFPWYGNTYTESAFPVHHTTNMAGCDSSITLNLTLNYSTFGDTTAIVCDSFMWYGVTYTADTMPVHHTINTLGCDSTVTLNLTVNYATVGDTLAVVCDSFMWHGVTYTADTMPVIHLPNVSGCDSTLTLNLTILQSSLGDTMAIACDRFEWYGTEYYESSDSATYTLTNAVGCDSVVTLYLTINHSSVDTIVTSATGSYEWQGYVLDSSGVYLDSLQTVDGCDSILVLQLTILQGIQEVDGGMITVYPNPTSGRIKVAADDVLRIDVYNVNGQLVKTIAKESVIDISSLPSSVYTMKIETDQSKFVCRVIKK